MLALALLCSCGAPRLPEATGAVRLDGAPFSTADLRGRSAWLEFWSPWDPASRQRIQDLPLLLERNPGWPRRARLVAVAVNGTAAEVREALPPGFPFEVVLDAGSLAGALGVQAVPTSAWVEADGRLRILREGYVEPALLEQLLEPRISGASGAAAR